MVDAKQLLTDLKRLRRTLEQDLREEHAASPQRAAAEAEWREALEARRTADTFDTFWTAAIDQAAVHWILAVVFLRFLEDNLLLDRPVLSGPGERLELAQARQAAYVQRRPLDTDTDYLLDIFAEVARLPGLVGLYDPAHNPLFRLPLSGDGGIALLAFFRDRVPETGALAHDFTDADWNTRFLGDLYQGLSEDARKRYALLQTPDFVEAWILDRTLTPAMQAFGATAVRMIDPTCGSGHFLLGGFARVLAAWQEEAPDMPPAAQAQRALDAVSGVDLNPFAVEIARFRLLLAALKAASVSRLSAAPEFRFSLAIGDSLLHGTHFGRQGDFSRALDSGFQRRLRHHFVSEDTAAVDAILGRQYHAVVGNPPYITPKDAAMRDAYREIYDSCHRTYGLGAPFTERFFDLAQAGTTRVAGFVGLIVANSFMKREFGKKLIEDVLSKLDLTHVVDCSGAYIPGHGTPTAIIFGRNRAPVGDVVRTVRGVRGEPAEPEKAAEGLVWSAIVAQVDQEKSESEYISTEDTRRAVLNLHPWSLGGGGAAEVQAAIEEAATTNLVSHIVSVGFHQDTHADDAFVQPLEFFRRYRLDEFYRVQVRGENVRDWSIAWDEGILFPYSKDLIQFSTFPLSDDLSWLWSLRTTLWNRTTFGGGTYLTSGRPWFDFHQFPIARARIPAAITFGEVSTHNHFVFDRGGKVFNRTAPVIKLPAGASEDDHLGLLGLLNSSTACFWLKQVCYPKGGDHVGGEGARVQKTKWDERYSFNGANIERFPLVDERPVDLARTLDKEAQRLVANLPAGLCAHAQPTVETLLAARSEAEAARARMISLQEEMDWRCYRLYGLYDMPPEHTAPPPLHLGERAFEIVMARQMAAGTLETAWFTRHRSTPITKLPAHWPEDYRSVVEHRIALIEIDSTIGLIERPEYKRRWSMEPWETLERDALRIWLLDRLEDPRFWPEPRLASTSTLADRARHDSDFLAVAALYAGTDSFELDALVAELVTKESVPFLAPLRYSESGLRKRAEWEATWEKQRQEDAIDAELAAARDTFLRAAWAKQFPREEEETAEAYAARMQAGLTLPEVQRAADAAIARAAKERKAKEIGPIPVPPKYRTPDFQSQDFWRLRNGLDVPKERFVSFPHCAQDADGTLPVLWAGFDHLARATALATWYVERKDGDGWPAERLVPLLAGLLELVPWLLQWHNDVDEESGLRMGEYFTAYVDDEARSLGLTRDDLRAWTPPAPARRPRGRRAAS